MRKASKCFAAGTDHIGTRTHGQRRACVAGQPLARNALALSCASGVATYRFP